MTDPVKLSGLNRAVLDLLAPYLRSNQINFIKMANNLPTSTPQLVRTLIEQAAENNHLAVQVIDHLLKNEQAKAYDLIMQFKCERGER